MCISTYEREKSNGVFMSKFNVFTYLNVNFIPVSNYCVYYFLFGALKEKYVTDRNDDLE